MPIAAIDGALSTKWQPTNATECSSLLVNLTGSGFYPITRIYFDWAQEPPTAYSVLFHNQSDITANTAVNVTSSDNVTLSNPFDVSTMDDVVAYSSNSTNVTLSEPVWS